MTAPQEPEQAGVCGRPSRESAFHDAWSESVDPAEVPVAKAFAAATCPENRHIADWLGDVSGLRVLDLGAGAGEAATWFALRGAQVTAADLSDGMLRLAEAVGRHHGVAFECVCCPAEELPFEPESFDVVYAANVFHHADKARALDEVRRVLRPGGRLACWDPLAHNPLINVYRRLARSVRSADERPLRMRDLSLFRERFSCVEHRTFWLFTLWLFLRFYVVEHVSPARERYWKKVVRESERLEGSYARLRRLDDWVLSKMPWLGRYCWNLVVCATK